MSENLTKQSIKLTLLLFFLCLSACAHRLPYSYDTDRAQIIATNQAIRDGFAAQDVSKILQFHHPDVEKVLAWNDYQKGHGDMSAALNGIFNNYILEFEGSPETMDSLDVYTETAVMIAPFTVKGTSKQDSKAGFEFSGRTMIVYVRSTQSPTGWVTLREMVVPKS